MTKKVAVVLSGCGFKDGSEIHEATCTLLALAQQGAEYQCFAPNRLSFAVNHLTMQPENEQRNILTEAARIARGKILALSALHGDDFDAVIFPGGFGAASQLSNFGDRGEKCEVDADVARVVAEFAKIKKPIGAICIAPATLAKALQLVAIKAKLTIGNEAGVAQKIEALGHTHVNCSATDCVVDEAHKIVSTPAYMNAKNVAEVYTGVAKLVEQVLWLA